MQVGKELLAERTKPVCGKLGSPFLAVVARSIALKAFHDPGKGCDPLDVIVADVPDQTKSAARLEHAMDLMKGLGRGKPMKALRADDRVNRCIAERDGFGRAASGFNFGILPYQLIPHRRYRFHSDNLRSRGQKTTRELPCTCA